MTVHRVFGSGGGPVEQNAGGLFGGKRPRNRLKLGKQAGNDRFPVRSGPTSAGGYGFQDAVSFVGRQGRSAGQAQTPFEQVLD